MAGVHTHIGAYHILHGVDLVVPKGQVTLLLGRNGAGKTTTLRTLMGLWAASQGSIRWNGQDITATDTASRARLGVGYVPESMAVFADLTVAENLLLAAHKASRMEDVDAQRLQWIKQLFPAVETFWHYPAGKLSGGQKQMVAVARAVIEPRELLVIDEPSKGLAPAIVANLLEALKEVKRQGTTILLVEQNLAFARRLGDQVAVMEDGRIVHAASQADFIADQAAQQRYLGLSL
ncbi:MAG: ABC transporter ATP-binding protein [Betaproteobacteria bacterium]|nr:ABC transporter ATP-binding protein [Betaproteobacteria bacterium]